MPETSVEVSGKNFPTYIGHIDVILQLRGGEVG